MENNKYDLQRRVLAAKYADILQGFEEARDDRRIAWNCYQQILTACEAMRDSGVENNFICCAVNKDIREQEVRRDLLTRRQEITEEVFQKAKDALRAFAASEAYAAFLERAVQEAAVLFTAGDTVFCMRPEDSKWQKTVQKAFGAPCTFAQDGKIHLGGFVVRSKSLGLAADQTLDAMLEDQRAWFEANAGLSIE